MNAFGSSFNVWGGGPTGWQAPVILMSASGELGKVISMAIGARRTPPSCATGLSQRASSGERV